MKGSLGGQGAHPFYLALFAVLAYTIYLLAQRPPVVYTMPTSPYPTQGKAIDFTGKSRAGAA